MRHDQDSRRINSEKALDFQLAHLRADDDRRGAAQHRGVKGVAMLPVTVGGDLRKPGLQAMLEIPDHDHIGHFQHLAGRAELPDEFDTGGLKLLIQRTHLRHRLASAKQGSALRCDFRIERDDFGIGQRPRRKLRRRVGMAQENEGVPRLRADREQRVEDFLLEGIAAPRRGIAIPQQNPDAHSQALRRATSTICHVSGERF